MQELKSWGILEYSYDICGTLWESGQICVCPTPRIMCDCAVRLELYESMMADETWVTVCSQ
jgi:hypothetical protein